jgi:hypothetical protein
MNSQQTSKSAGRDVKENSMGGAAHLRVVIIASLGGTLFGFATGHRRRRNNAARNFFSLSPAGPGAAVSSALWATWLGAFVVGGSGDLYGSRNVLRVVGLLYVLSAQRSALAWKHVVRCVDSSPESPSVDPQRPRWRISRKSRRLIGAERWWVCSKSTSRSVSCLSTPVIFASRGSSPQQRCGDASSQCPRAGYPIIYGFLPLLSYSSRRLQCARVQ